MKVPRDVIRFALRTFAPWRLCVRLFVVREKRVVCPMCTTYRFRPSAYCILLSAFCLLSAAFCLVAKGQAPNAVSVPAGEVSKHVNDLILQGFDLLSQHDAAGAEKAFRQAIDAQPEVESSHRGLALALRDQGRLEEAFRELRIATQLNPADSDAHYTLGSVSWALSLPANLPAAKRGGMSSADYQTLAGAEFSKALALSPKDPMLRMNLAALYLNSNRGPDAIHQGEEAVRMAPGNADTHVILGRSYFASGEEERAAKEYEAAMKIDPRNGQAFLAMGEMRMVQHRTPQAEEYLRQAIQLSPQLGPAYSALAEILMSEDKDSEARALLEKAVTLNSQDWQSQYKLAVLLNQAGETARATDLLDKVLKANPNFPGAREQLARGILRRGDIPGATTMAGQMIAEDPQGPEGHRVMALVLWKQRDYDGSLAECAMALNVDQNHSAMLALQSIALWQVGRKKEAQTAYRYVAKIEPKVGNADVFCRLLLCDAHDINIVSDFLHKNRWVLAPLVQP
jgi:Tfp pilus assembly protein PilF